MPFSISVRGNIGPFDSARTSSPRPLPATLATPETVMVLGLAANGELLERDY